MNRYKIQYELNGDVRSEECQYLSDLFDTLRLLIGNGVNNIKVSFNEDQNTSNVN
jgi:hypothetical protein